MPASGGGEPVCLTPESPEHPETASCLFRFADMVVDASRRRLIAVREDHTHPEPSRVVNEVVAVPLDGSGGPVEVLATGADFYGAPRLSPDGAKLCFVRWFHPSMPWVATDLVVAALDPAGRALAGEVVVRGAAAGSHLQPAWCPASGDLLFISDASNGFYNLHRVAGSGGAAPDASWADKVT